MTASATAYDDIDDETIDDYWRTLRTESTSIRYVMIGTSFVSEGALSDEVNGPRLPNKDVRAPLEATWLVDFEKLSMRRTQHYPIFRAGEPQYRLRSATDVYTPQGRKTLVPADKNQLNVAEPEFYINRPVGYVEAWDNPILLAHGYFGTGRGGNTFKSIVAPLKAVGLLDLGEITEDGRVLRVFGSGLAEPVQQMVDLGQPLAGEDYLSFDEYFLDPQIGHRVVRKREWLRGRVRTEMNLAYGKTDKGVYYLSHFQIKNFDWRAEQQKLLEEVSLKTKSFENDATGSFDLQPVAGMLVKDEETMETRRQ